VKWKEKDVNHRYQSLYIAVAHFLPVEIKVIYWDKSRGNRRISSIMNSIEPAFSVQIY